MVSKTFNQGESHAYSSQPSGKKLHRPRQPITRLVDKTFNQLQFKLTPHKHQRRSSTKRRGSIIAWMTRPLIRLKSNLRWFHLPLYFTQDHQGFPPYITKALLPTSPRFFFLRHKKFHSCHNGLFILPQETKHHTDKRQHT